MESKERYIFDALITLPNFKSFDFKIQGEIITLVGSKRGFLKTEETKITIQKSHANKKNALVKAQVNENIVSEELQKEFLYAILREVKILNNEQFVQLIILLNNENGKINDFSDFALHAFQTQINDTWPKLKDDIHLQVLGDRNEELAFVVNKGLDDEEFQAFFHYGIKLKATIRNCRNFKIEKLVFFDKPKNEFMAFTIEEMEQMDLT
jgi:hypothetical protein